MKCNISKTANLCIWVIINSTKLLICSYSSEMKIYAWCNVPAKCFKFWYIFGIWKPIVVFVYFVIYTLFLLTYFFHQPNFEIFRWAFHQAQIYFFSEEYNMQLLCKLHRLNKIASYNPQTVSANDFYVQIIIFFKVGAAANIIFLQFIFFCWKKKRKKMSRQKP